MKLSREALVLAGVIIGFALISIFAGHPTGQVDTSAAHYSTYSSRPDGSKALYLFLRQEGYRVERWERPLGELPKRPDTLILVWPEEPLDEKEAGVLNSWVRSGGTLIAVPAGDRTLTPDTRASGTEDSVLSPRQATPAAAQVRRIHVAGRRRFAPPRDWLEIFGDAAGPVVVAKTLGQGRIFALSDPELLSNQGIEREDNLTLAIYLVAPAPGGRILFDEYHHGYQTPPGLWESLPPALRGAALQLGLALAFYLYLRGRRFGHPIPLPQAPPRAGVEYVLAQANIYRRARAGRAALGYLYRALRAELSSSLGLSAGIPHADLAAAAARRYGWEAEDLEALLKRCEDIANGAKSKPGGPRSRQAASEAATPSPATEVEILRFARRIDHYRRESKARGSNCPTNGG